jgi:CRP-like cAMP-binding protein
MAVQLHDLKSFSCFEKFPDSILQELCTKADVHTFQSGQDILQQGIENSKLYFLKSGAVDILVDGELIFTLQQPGEVLGEMSFISHKLTSAQVRASATTSVIVLDAARLSAESKSNFDMSLFFRAMAASLADRLRSTNEKAKQHEIMNKHLEELVANRTADLEKSMTQLEVQNSTLLAGFRALEDQESRRQSSIQKINGLQERTLPQLKATVTSLMSYPLEPDQLKKVELASAEVDSIQSELEKLQGFFKADGALATKKVLLLEAQKKQQLVTKMALGGTGVGLEIASDPEAAAELLRTQAFDLILSDSSFVDFLKMSHNSYPELPIAVMISGKVEDHLPTLKELEFVSHIVSRNVNDRSLTVKTIVTTINKVLTEDFLGLEKYLSWGVDVHEVIVRKSSERAQVIEEMKEKLRKIGIRNTILDSVGVVVEEQLMNSIYDAPCDSHGKSLFNHLPRTALIELGEHQASRLRYACDGNFIAVSVRDPFGGLTRDIIFKYLQSCYDNQAGQLQENKGGAGRGLHQIIENADLTVFNVQKRKVSEVISLFQVDAKDPSDALGSTLHYFFF